MTPQDWARIKQVFSEALNLAPRERDAYVESACPDDPDVRRAVVDLLDAHYKASQTFLEPSTIVLATTWLFREGDRVAGRFSVVRRIARGAMGEVYQVYDERLRLQIALKAIRPELLGNADTVERFRREVLVTRDIAHDGLCRVFDLVEHVLERHDGFADGTVVPCLTMQLLDGESLDDWLVRNRPMSPADALPLIGQIAEALQVLHDAGVVHRDLKPSNVMLVDGPEGRRAVLTDFGLAKPLDESVFETQTTVQGGAPFFMAPELFRGERPSRASDIYAFGLLIDEMVTTERAFSAESLHALLLQKLGEGPRAPAARSTVLPREWDRTIRRCVAREAGDRFESAIAVSTALAGGAAPRRRPSVRRLLRRITPATPSRVATVGAVIVLALTGAAAVGKPIGSPTAVTVRTFENLTQRPELEYLAAGTAGELARRLSRMRAVRVYTVTDPKAAPPKAVSFSVHGQIQAVDAQLRITVQITDAAVSMLLWSQRFDGPVNQALQLEDQLAAATAGELARLQTPGRAAGVVNRALDAVSWLLPSLRGRVPSSGTTNSAAFDAYLRGRTLFEERTIPGALQAIEYLQRAVREDPNYAAAYATLADVQGVLMDLNHAPHATLLKEAERYMEQAVALDPDLPEVQLSLGALRQAQWRWKEAETAYKRAIDLHPTSARAHRWYGGLLLQFGRFDESLEKHRYALELDPSDFPSQSALGQALYMSGRPLEAAAHLERLLERKDLFYAHTLLGQTYAFLQSAMPGQRDLYLEKALARSAIVRAKDPLSLNADGRPGLSVYADLIAALAWSYAGKPDGAAPYLARLIDGRAGGRVTSGLLSRIYAAQGDTRRAMDFLLDAEVHHERDVYYINVSPAYRAMRDEPQFRALVERLGLSR